MLFGLEEEGDKMSGEVQMCVSGGAMWDEDKLAINNQRCTRAKPPKEGYACISATSASLCGLSKGGPGIHIWACHREAPGVVGVTEHFSLKQKLLMGVPLAAGKRSGGLSDVYISSSAGGLVGGSFAVAIIAACLFNGRRSRLQIRQPVV